MEVTIRLGLDLGSRLGLQPRLCHPLRATETEHQDKKKGGGEGKNARRPWGGVGDRPGGRSRLWKAGDRSFVHAAAREPKTERDAGRDEGERERGPKLVRCPARWYLAGTKIDLSSWVVGGAKHPTQTLGTALDRQDKTGKNTLPAWLGKKGKGRQRPLRWAYKAVFGCRISTCLRCSQVCVIHKYAQAAPPCMYIPGLLPRLL